MAYSHVSDGCAPSSLKLRLKVKFALLRATRLVVVSLRRSSVRTRMWGRAIGRHKGSFSRRSRIRETSGLCFETTAPQVDDPGSYKFWARAWEIRSAGQGFDLWRLGDLAGASGTFSHRWMNLDIAMIASLQRRSCDKSPLNC